jgi:hypothetical protein
LDCFLKHHNIVFGKISGERRCQGNHSCLGVINLRIFLIWTKQDYIYFLEILTRYTFHKKGDDCAGSKRSKERLTVALCASMTGENLRPLVNGKCENPRCFKKISVESLKPTDEYPWQGRNSFNSGIFVILKKL